jgi:hypothetical protein
MYYVLCCALDVLCGQLWILDDHFEIQKPIMTARGRPTMLVRGSFLNVQQLGVGMSQHIDTKCQQNQHMAFGMRQQMPTNPQMTCGLIALYTQ